MTLSENIKAVREMKNVTQTELAEMLGVNQTFISQIERGVRTPSVAALESIADALDCSVDGLLGRTTDHAKNRKEN